MRAAARILSALLALALFAGAVVVVIEVIRMLAGTTPLLIPADDWLARGRSSRWGDSDVQLVLAAGLLAGLALVVFALWPRRIHALETSTTTSGVDLYVERRGLERLLGDRVQRVDGIRSAGVELKKRRVVVRARPTAAGPDNTDDVRETTSAALAAFGVGTADRVSVRLERRSA